VFILTNLMSGEVDGRELSCLTCVWFVSFQVWDECFEENGNQGFCECKRSLYFYDKIVGEGICCRHWANARD